MGIGACVISVRTVSGWQVMTWDNGYCECSTIATTPTIPVSAINQWYRGVWNFNVPVTYSKITDINATYQNSGCFAVGSYVGNNHTPQLVFLKPNSGTIARGAMIGIKVCGML